MGPPMKKVQKKAAQGWNLHLAVFLHRLGDRFALADLLADFGEQVLEHRVAGRFAGDVESLENRHAAGDEGAQGAGGAGEDAFFDQLAEDRHLQA